MRDGNRIQIPRCHGSSIVTEDALEGSYGGVGKLAALIGRVTYGVGNGHMVIPLPIRIAAPSDARIVTDLAVHLKPDARLMIRGHLCFEKLDKRSLHQRVIL